jgi:hypothetical protein
LISHSFFCSNSYTLDYSFCAIKQRNIDRFFCGAPSFTSSPQHPLPFSGVDGSLDSVAPPIDSSGAHCDPVALEGFAGSITVTGSLHPISIIDSSVIVTLDGVNLTMSTPITVSHGTVTFLLSRVKSIITS